MKVFLAFVTIRQSSPTAASLELEPSVAISIFIFLPSIRPINPIDGNVASFKKVHLTFPVQASFRIVNPKDKRFFVDLTGVFRQIAEAG